LPVAPFGVKEHITRARSSVPSAAAPGVELFTSVSDACEAKGFSTGLAKFKPAATLPYHRHNFSEAVTIVEGVARVTAEGRSYLMGPRDAVHFPAGTAHQVENASSNAPLTAHWAFPTSTPTRELVSKVFPIVDRGCQQPTQNDPEHILRYNEGSIYELSTNAFFLDLFARRYGSVGICGGHGRFLPGASLPCHTHDYDESITIVKGTAICLVQGRRYQLSDCDCAFIPRGLPHRFLNLSNEEMEMVWVYAGSEPDRQIIDASYCSGDLAWPPHAQTE
jgi:putative monooxygenase